MLDTSTRLPTNYWWKFDAADSSMTHSETGERVVFRGEIDIRYKLIADKDGLGRENFSEPGWYRFDYQFDREVYPLLVGMGSFSYPNPDPYNFGGPLSDTEARIGPFLSGWSWIIDHHHSSRLWRLEYGMRMLEPSYSLWKRADLAIMDVAFLWGGRDSESWTRGQRPARELALRGGWLNNAWRTDLQRRVGMVQNLVQDSPNFSISLTDQPPAEVEVKPGIWSLSRHHESRSKTASPAWRLVNEVRNSTIHLIAEDLPEPRKRLTAAGATKRSGAEDQKQRFKIDITGGADCFTLYMEPRSLIYWPQGNYKGDADRHLPFGADWKIDLRRLTRHQLSLALDVYRDAIVPLCCGLLGDFPTLPLPSHCIALFSVPISGDKSGVMIAIPAGQLPKEKQQFGWDEFFF